MSALTYETAKKQVTERREAAQDARSEVAGRGSCRGRSPPASPAGPSQPEMRSTTVPAFVPQVAQRIDQAAAELLGQDDVGEAAPGVGMAVHERGVHGGPDRQLQEEHDHRRDQHADAGQDGPPAQDDAPVGRQHEQADGRRQEQRQRVIGHGDAVHQGRGHEPPVGVADDLRVLAAPPPLPRSGAAGTGSRPGPGGACAGRHAWPAARTAGCSRESGPWPSATKRLPVSSWTMPTVPATAAAAVIACSRFIR